MLTTDSILVNGMVQRAPAPVSNDHQVQLSAILWYLHEVHGFSEIEPWFAESLRSDTASAERRFKSPEQVAELMGIEFSPYRRLGRDEYFSVSVDPRTPISIAGYDRMVRAGYRSSVSNTPAKRPGASEIETTKDSVIVKLVADSVPIDSIVIPLRPLIDRIILDHASANGSFLPGEQVVYEYESPKFRTKVVMLQAHFQRQDSTIVANSYDALIFYSQKSED
jgi:hypothetical protein